MTTLSVHITRAAPTQPPAKLYRVVYDNECPDWGKPRTQVVTRPDGSYFSQLPAVYGYSPEPVPSPDNYRVDESWLEQDYIRINNYDGDGLRRCQNYLWKDDTALYNAQGFPRRELLTMSNNVLQEIEWLSYNGERYLKFKTLRPGNSVAGMTWATNPQFVHRFTLVSNTGYTTHINQWEQVYYYLVSPDGYAFMPERFVKAGG